MADEILGPLKPSDAKQLILGILRSGRFTYSKHAKDEMLADDLTNRRTGRR